MIIAWITFASTGIFFARYFKFLFDERPFCGVQFWFFIHRPVMIFVPICSIAALLVILAQLNWKWVSSSQSISLAHSIVGIVAICLSFFQVHIQFVQIQVLLIV
jgi:hypothetical protein